MIPSRRDLASQYFVSLLTIGRAVEPLLADGTLRSDDRRGTFVAGANTANGKMESPSMVASAALGGKSPVSNVGMVAYIARDDFPEQLIVHTIEHVLSTKGDRVSLFNRYRGAGKVPAELIDEIDIALSSDINALIIICLDRDVAQTDAVLSDARLNNLPVVCILAGEIQRQISHVFYDNRSGGYQAMQHLMEHHHERYTIVSPFTATWTAERIAGVRSAAAHARVSEGNINLITGDGKPWRVLDDPRPMAYRATKSAIEAGWVPTGGIVGISDGVARGVIDAAAEIGLRPGIHYAIIGYDDGLEARDCDLTSVRPPMEAMAREATRLLYDHARGLDMSLQIRLNGHVIQRGSSRLLASVSPVFRP